MRVYWTNDGWLYKDIIWDSDFMRAIAPVDFQLITAERFRKRAERTREAMIKIHFLEKARALEESASSDAQCEVKWGARKE